MLGRGKGKGEEMGEAGIACTVGRRDAAMLEEELAGLVHHSVMHRVDLDDGVAVWMGWGELSARSNRARYASLLLSFHVLHTGV